MRTTILLVFIIMGSFPLMRSQNPFQELQFILGDVVFLSEQYIANGADAAAYQSTTAWSSKAKNLNLFEIDVSIHFNNLFIPKAQRTFTARNSNFNSLEIQGAESAPLPTVLGGETTTFFNFDIEGESNEFLAFEGVGKRQLFHPFLQASLGLWKGTDLTVRYSPDIKISDIGYGIFGAGIKHNFSQYLKKTTSNNPVELAFQVAYSRFSFDFSLDAFQIESQALGGFPLLSVNELDITSNSWLFEALVSKRFKKVEFQGGLGMVAFDTQFIINGENSFTSGLLDEVLQDLTPTQTLIKVDIGVNYYFKNFYISSVLTFGDFVNYNTSLHYNI